MSRIPNETRILAGAVVAMFVATSCSGGAGPVHLNVELVVEHCPLVTSWSASPLQVSAPGGTIDVSVTAHEEVAADAGNNPLQYMWSATAGTFSDSASPTSVYKCAAAGPQVLTASVTDNNRRVPCADVITVAVMCEAPPP